MIETMMIAVLVGMAVNELACEAPPPRPSKFKRLASGYWQAGPFRAFRDAKGYVQVWRSHPLRKLGAFERIEDADEALAKGGIE